jgi:uncharacterized membrane protein (UPF0127 family)
MGKMRSITVQSLKNQAVISDKCFVAERFFDRLVGLMGRDRLEPGEGLLFPECRSVHMWFMRIPIDIVFLARGEADGDREVVAVFEQVRPWKLLPVGSGRARDALELPSGTAGRAGIAVGDRLCLS